MRKNINLLFASLVCQLSFAQMPDTEVYLFKLKTDKQNKISISDSINITQRNGYDNQPSFSSDEKKIFYVSVREDKQADVFQYDIKSKKTLKLTYSAESEYSPVAFNANQITSVVVEKDSSQKIHFINSVSGLNEGSLSFDSVGYCTFINADTLLYYKLTDPHSLRYHCISTSEDKFICNSPVRGFKKINRHAFIFGIKSQDKVTFYSYDFLLQKAEKYCEYPSLDEDIIWHPDWGLLKSEATKILHYREKEKTWEELFDLSKFGIKKITRFIFDTKNKYLVVVNNL